MSLQFSQKIIYAECKVCMKFLSKPKIGGKMDNGVRKFVTNAQDTSKAVCGSCGFTTSINSLIAQEIQEISLEDLT